MAEAYIVAATRTAGGRRGGRGGGRGIRAARRRTRVNARVAAAHVGDVPEGRQRVEGTAARIGVPVADLLRAPDGPRDRQLVYGEPVTVYEDRDGWSFLQAAKDGHSGYVPSSAVTAPFDATHWDSAPATHAYTGDDYKSPDSRPLSHDSRCQVTAVPRR